MLRTIVKYISRIISYIIPKSKIFLFFSYPNFTDNSYALYLYILLKPEYIKYKKVWIIDYNEPDFDRRIQQIKKIDDNTIVVKRSSLSSLWYYYRAKYFFFTHSLYSSFILKDKNKRINLWHGMPLKRIAAMQKNTTYRGVNSDVLISTSEMFQDLMARSFIQPQEKVLICGQPRNDLFWEDTDYFAETGINKDNYNRVGMWLPTYRSSISEDGNILNEGNSDNFLSFLTREDISSLNAVLAQLNYLLIVKFHPMDVLNDEQMSNYSNIRFHNKYNFNYQLYPLLGEMDFLLTDYSSVWVDYEILNRPIGFVINDMEQYGNDRGFTIDNLVEKLPGEIITNFESLRSFLFNPTCGNNTEIVWNEFKDNKSSARLMNCLDLKNNVVLAK